MTPTLSADVLKGVPEWFKERLKELPTDTLADVARWVSEELERRSKGPSDPV